MKITPPQTVGPFFHDCMTPLDAPWLRVDPDTDPRRIRIVGTVVDGRGAPLDDAMVETWRARERRSSEGDSGAGWARAATDAAGQFDIDTVRPVALPHPSGGEQAPHIVVVVFARGLLDRLVTRAYLPSDDVLGDPVLQTVPEARRHTLLARLANECTSPTYRFDIRLQGDDETVFFEV